MRVVANTVMADAGVTGAWRWLDAGEVTRDGDLTDFQGHDATTWGPADPGYEVMADEEFDFMRRVEERCEPVSASGQRCLRQVGHGGECEGRGGLFESVDVSKSGGSDG